MSLCGAKWLEWVVCICVYVGWVLLVVRVVKGVWIWRHKKRARNQLQKVGSRSDLHSARKIAGEQCKTALS